MSGLMAENSAIQITPEIEAALKQAASHEEMKGILTQAAVDQHLVTRDAVNPSILLPAAPGTQPRAYGKTLTINGVKHTIQAPTEAELVHKENELLRATFEGRPAARTERPARDENTGRFVSAEARGKQDEAAQLEIVRQSELELKFRRGELSSAEYLAQSGAFEKHLASQGIDPEVLRETVIQKQDEKTIQSWQQATDAFLNGPAGSDWPGGQENLKLIGDLIRENGLENSPSVETLSACWEHIKTSGLVKSNPELESHQAIADATDFESIRTAARGGSSSMFGR